MNDVTPTPATPEPATPSTPEPAAPQTPAPTDATPANPVDGTGQPSQVRNAPEGGDVDYKEKFAASTRENQRQADILRQHGIDPKTGERSTPATPPATPAPAAPAAAPTQPLTHEQAVAQIPGFNALTKEEQAIVLNPRQAYRDIEQVKQQTAIMYDKMQTDAQIKELTAKDAYKDLDQDGFREFIYREDNLGVKNLETLAKMFAIEQEAANPPAPPTPEGGEATTSGAKEIAAGSGTQEITSAEAAQLRTTDPRRYAKLIKEGKLRITS